MFQKAEDPDNFAYFMLKMDLLFQKLHRCLIPMFSNPFLSHL
jgi:hypothetical protein